MFRLCLYAFLKNTKICTNSGECNVFLGEDQAQGKFSLLFEFLRACECAFACAYEQ